jgi:nucleoside-diphosphate-sugar epimerase
MSTVFITGATGFIGRHVCTTLLAAGWTVRGLARGARRDALVPGVEPIVGALDDVDALRRGVDGAQHVVHLAGRAHVMKRQTSAEMDEYRRVHVTGTRDLVAACNGAALESFVLVSSIAAATPEQGDAATRAYAATKAEAERVAATLWTDAAVPVTILRPVGVYGPGMRGRPLQLFRYIARGWPLPLAAAPTTRSLCYVGNLAHAVRSVLERPGRGVRTFDVADTTALTTRELVERVATLLGRRPRILSVPVPALRAAGRAGDIIARVAAVPLGSVAVERLLSSLRVSPDALVEQTGYREPYDVQTGLARTAEWYSR